VVLPAYTTTPIPANPALEPNSATKVASVLIGPSGTTHQGVIGLGFGKKFVVASTDPSVTVSATTDTTHLISGTATLLTKWGPFRVPTAASGGGESSAPLTAAADGTTSQDYEDHWLFLKDPARASTAAPYGVQFDLWRYKAEAGHMAAASLTVWALNSDGTTSFNRLDGGGTGAGLGTQGLITRAEMTKTTVGSFGHALFFASRGDKTSSDFRTPATKTDGTVVASTDTLPEGCRVQLDPSINISGLTGLSVFEQNVALTLQSHGAYLTDRSSSETVAGTAGMNIQVEGGDPTDLRAQAPTATVPWGYAGDPIRAVGAGGGVGSNLLTNGGAENGLTGMNGSGATLATVTTPARTGAAAFRLTTTTAGTVQVTQTANVAVTAAKGYTISGWTRAATVGRSIAAGIDWYSSAGTYLTSDYVPNVTSSTTGWTQSTASVTAPANATQAQVFLIVGGTALNEQHYVDDLLFAPNTGTNPAGQYSTFIPYDFYEMPHIPWRTAAGVPTMRVLAVWDGSGQSAATPSRRIGKYVF